MTASVAKWLCPGCGATFQAGNVTKLTIMVCPCGWRATPENERRSNLRLVDPPQQEER